MANSRNHYMEDLWSDDDSEDDNYNYLKALDNINWNRQDSGLSNPFNYGQTDRRNVAKKGSGPASRTGKPVTRPAVAVKTKSNRNDFLLKDMIASEKDKTKDIPKNENNSESVVVNKKRDFDLIDDIEDIDNIVVINDIQLKTKISNNSNNDNKSDNNLIQKNKKPKVNESEYEIKDVLNKKKANHEKSVSNNNNNIQNKSDLNRVKRDFGKAFSPTVYSPEVPVMRGPPQTSAQQISNINVIQKALTFNSDESTDTKYSPDSILAVILNWNTMWLKEGTESEVPQLLSPFGEGIGLKTCYESLEEYQSAYIPLILFETWAQIYKDFSSDKQMSFQAVRGPDITSDEHFMYLNLHTVIPMDKIRDYPSEGYLSILEMVIDYSADNEKRKVVLFGYIQEFICEKITPTTTLLPGLSAPPSHLNPQLLKFVFVLTKRPIRIGVREIINVKAFHYLKPTVRQIELIANLNTSPLFKDILKPRSFTCQVVVPTTVSLSCVNFNESQNRAILGSSEALSRPYAVPKLLFIQGPPGTGKTHTLIGILKHIYNKWDSEDRLPRILICAPSNGAVDEISRRICRERHFLLKHRFEKHRRYLRCVRIGKESQIHPDVRKILFEQLIRDNVENESKRLNEQKDKKTKELDEKTKKLDQEIANLRASGNKKELSRAEKEMSNLMLDYQKITGPKEQANVGNKAKLRMDIMNKADIVLSTLNSSHSSPIENLFRNCGPTTFDCCIVDEASQCSEPELLMPLIYKMTKMILIGDPMQLPATVISKKASSLKLGRSLFERFYHYFCQCEKSDSEQKSPILMLTEQYRMHPQICQFPSSQFYGGKLLSSPKVIKSRDFIIKPYIVFDVTDSVENKSDPTNKYNELEATFVIRLTTIIDEMLNNSTNNGHKYSVGVITPYNGQKNHLINRFKKINSKNIVVEVNTVDGFQGQERDIIILSAVRAFDKQNNQNKWQSIGFLDSVQRMNVALTRAKYSMILCISCRSLETNKNWNDLIVDSIKRTNTRFRVPSTLGSEKLKKMLEPIETISIGD